MVLFSTHRFDMVERLCSRAIVLSAGRIVARESIPSAVVDTPTDLEAVFHAGHRAAGLSAACHAHPAGHCRMTSWRDRPTAHLIRRFPRRLLRSG
jgi:ABC-type methionine transport system ATPase subunit